MSGRLLIDELRELIQSQEVVEIRWTLKRRGALAVRIVKDVAFKLMVKDGRETAEFMSVPRTGPSARAGLAVAEATQAPRFLPD